MRRAPKLPRKNKRQIIYGKSKNNLIKESLKESDPKMDLNFELFRKIVLPRKEAAE